MRSVLSLTLFIKTLKSANAVFLELLILLVIPNVQSMELRHLRYFVAVGEQRSDSGRKDVATAGARVRGATRGAGAAGMNTADTASMDPTLH